MGEISMQTLIFLQKSSVRSAFRRFLTLSMKLLIFIVLFNFLFVHQLLIKKQLVF